ncbi:hypothetical protein [Melissospora conviva]|uniref:hypothetical protein n=1 Tax=Melissospora conviva TaxID=3388432 RepID=UPI003C158AC8
MPEPLPPPNFTSGAAYPEIGRLRIALTAGDFATVRKVFAGLDTNATTIAVGTATDIGGIEAALGREWEANPDDALIGTLLGAHLIQAGWTIRTAALAKYVSREQFEGFRAYLCRAEQVLIDVTARHPDYVSAWAKRLTSARGLQLGPSELRRRYDRLAAHDPHHLPAQSSVLQKLCPKWGGSWPAVQAFVKECTDTAPPGSHNAVLVCEGHLEYMGTLGSKKKAVEYLQDPRVRQEIYAAAERSVWHADFTNAVGWVWVRATFACLFSLMGDHRAALTQFTALGPYGNASAFDYVGDGEQEFVRYRAEAYAKGAA